MASFAFSQDYFPGFVEDKDADSYFRFHAVSLEGGLCFWGLNRVEFWVKGMLADAVWDCLVLRL